MSENRRCLCAGLALALVLTALPSVAGEGRTPVFAPSAIVADGRYIVTRNIVGGGGAPVIDITASNVDLDLNGFTLTEPGGGFPVILVSAPSEVTIHDGTLAGGTVSIDAPGAGRKLVIEDVKSQDAAGPGAGAIHAMDIEEVVIRRCLIVDAPAIPGITLDGGAVTKTGTIEKNVIRGTALGIVVAPGQGVQVLHNSIQSTTPGAVGAGISLFGVGNLIAQNTIEDADGNGIELRPGSLANKIWNNTVFSSGGHGIYVAGAIGSGNNLVLDNVVSNCGFGGGGGGSGLRVENEQNKIEGNIFNENSGCGMHFSGPAALGNTFGRNMARGNIGVACPAAACPPLVFPNACDSGPGGNDTYGDNLIPGPPVS